MSDPVRPHRRQPTRLPRPWDFPGKNTGVGCHFLLQCMKVKSQSEVAQSCPTLSDPMDCSLPGSSIHGIFQARVLEWVAIAFSYVHQQLPELTQTHAHWIGDAIQPSHPLSSPSPPTISLSQHQGHSNESVLLSRWPKYWSFSFSISPSNEYSGLISFRMDRLHLPAVQGTLKSLLQHHSSKASILQGSAFFIVQLSYPYMTTGKIIALTRQNFIGKVMSLLFNMLSRLVITFLPRSKHLLIPWVQSPSAVILESKKLKSVTVSIVSPSICHEMMELDAWSFIFFLNVEF